MARKTLKRIILITLIMSIVLCNTVFVHAESTSTQDITIEYIRSIMDMIKEKYNGEVTDQELLEGALKGMFGTMDSYTTYFTLDQANSFLSDVEGTYTGIGVVLVKSGEYVEIAKVLPASPAEKAGIILGDKIVTVNGNNTVGISLDEMQSLLLGEEGTSVVVGILRNGHNGIIVRELTRAIIKLNPVSYEIRNDIGYIKIETFNSNTQEFMMEALDVMDEMNIEKIVLDLRDNPGGTVSQAVAVAGMFVPEGLITKLVFKSENMRDEEYYSKLKQPKYKLAVLVNQNSASASEILAGAIQDSNAGLLIGTKTFGKARVQVMVPLLTPEAYKKYSEKLDEKVIDAFELINVYRIMPLQNEIIGWSKITAGMYITPKGRHIDEIGLVPDIEVGNPLPINGVDVTSIQKLSITLKPTLDSEGYDVYIAEKILKALGYDVDNADTILDEKTFQAINKFRIDSKLYPGGVLDFTTQRELNKRLDEMVLKADTHYIKAVEALDN